MFRPDIKVCGVEDDFDWKSSSDSCTINSSLTEVNTSCQKKLFFAKLSSPKQSHMNTISLTIENQAALQSGLDIDAPSVNFISPHQQFFVLRHDNAMEREAAKFQNELNEFYLKQQNLPDFAGIKLNHAAIVSVDEKSFFRCIITKILDDRSEVEVLCVDIGKYLKVKSSSLKSLMKIHSKLPPWAIECRLSDIEVPENREIFKRIQELFEIFVESDYKTRIHVASDTTIISNPFAVHSVHLLFMKNNLLINFNAIIAGLRLAEESSTCTLMENIVKLCPAVEKVEIFEIDKLDVTNPGDIRFIRKEHKIEYQTLHKFLQISPFKKRVDRPWKIGDPCLVKYKGDRADENISNTHRGVVIKTDIDSSFSTVELIDRGIMVTKNNQGIYDYVDVSLIEVKPKIMKLGFPYYQELTESSKYNCYNNLKKFVDASMKNQQTEAKVDFKNAESPLLLELITYKDDSGIKIPKTFTITKPESIFMRNISTNVQSPITIHFNSTNAKDSKSYLTIDVDQKIILDMIPEFENSGWLPFSPPKTETFDAICKHVDENGNMYLCTPTGENIHKYLKRELKLFYSKSTYVESEYAHFMIGDPVIVFDTEKKEYCRGIIMEMDLNAFDGQFEVFLIDQGSSICKVSRSALSNLIVASKLPRLIGKFCFTNMINKKWTKLELRKLNDYILNRTLTVCITRKRGEIFECCISCVPQSNGLVIDYLNARFQVEDQSERTFKKFKDEVATMPMSLMELDQLVRNFKTKASEINDIIVDVTESAEDGTSEKFIAQSKKKVRKEEKEIWFQKKTIESFDLASLDYSIDEFSFSAAKYFNDRIYLKANIKKLNKLIHQMHLILLEGKFKSFKLSDQSGRKVKYCVLKRDDEYFRGKILKLDEFGDRASVLLVDVPEIVEEQPSNGNFYQMSPELFEIPLVNIRVKLKSSGPSSEEDEKQMETVVERLNTSAEFKNGNKVFVAKVFQFTPCGDSVVDIFDPDTDEKLS